MTVATLTILLLAAAPDAGPVTGPSAAGSVDLSRCTITANKGDRVQKGGDVVVRAGEVVEDAVAVNGNVIVKTGGSAKSALALHGSVIVEDGATVRGSVVAVGGKVLASKTAKIADSQVELGDSGLRIVSEDGHEVVISASVGGTNLARAILQPMLAKLHDCDVSATKD